MFSSVSGKSERSKGDMQNLSEKKNINYKKVFHVLYIIILHYLFNVVHLT